jgi:hypothetical protein
MEIGKGESLKGEHEPKSRMIGQNGKLKLEKAKIGGVNLTHPGQAALLVLAASR